MTLSQTARQGGEPPRPRPRADPQKPGIKLGRFSCVIVVSLRLALAHRRARTRGMATARVPAPRRVRAVPSLGSRGSSPPRAASRRFGAMANRRSASAPTASSGRRSRPPRGARAGRARGSLGRARHRGALRGDGEHARGRARERRVGVRGRPASASAPPPPPPRAPSVVPPRARLHRPEGASSASSVRSPPRRRRWADPRRLGGPRVPPTGGVERCSSLVGCWGTRGARRGRRRRWAPPSTTLSGPRCQPVDVDLALAVAVVTVVPLVGRPKRLAGSGIPRHRFAPEPGGHLQRTRR